MINKKKARLEKERAMAKLFRRKLVYRVKGIEIFGEIVDWNDEFITIQEKISEEPLVFQLITFERKLCEIFNPQQQNLNITPAL